MREYLLTLILTAAVTYLLTPLVRRVAVATGAMHAGRYLRFNPKTEQWTEYVLPEPYGIDRETWIDNSTNPVTVWYVDHEGWIVRIQPLE